MYTATASRNDVTKRTASTTALPQTPPHPATAAPQTALHAAKAGAAEALDFARRCVTSSAVAYVRTATTNLYLRLHHAALRLLALTGAGPLFAPVVLMAIAIIGGATFMVVGWATRSRVADIIGALTADAVGWIVLTCALGITVLVACAVALSAFHGSRFGLAITATLLLIVAAPVGICTLVITLWKLLTNAPATVFHSVLFAAEGVWSFVAFTGSTTWSGGELAIATVTEHATPAVGKLSTRFATAADAARDATIAALFVEVNNTCSPDHENNNILNALPLLGHSNGSFVSLSNNTTPLPTLGLPSNPFLSHNTSVASLQPLLASCAATRKVFFLFALASPDFWTPEAQAFAWYAAYSLAGYALFSAFPAVAVLLGPSMPLGVPLIVL